MMREKIGGELIRWNATIGLAHFSYFFRVSRIDKISLSNG
jgi:hypothetical protein